jgi:hypothetical protein
MDDVWDSFPCSIGDQAAYIGFNASFSERANESCLFKNFASFRVTFKAPAPDGLPSDLEFASLNALEDELSAGIQPEHGVQVGRTTFGGHRDFAFYTTLSDEQCFALIDSLHNEAQHEICLLHEQDPDFRHYWQALYPTLDDWQVIQDMRVEQALRERGDPVTDEREIIHWATFHTAGARQEFVKLLPEEVRVQELYEVDAPSDNRFIARLSHYGLPEHRSLNRTTIRLGRAAREDGGAYDGWETALFTVA